MANKSCTELTFRNSNLSSYVLEFLGSRCLEPQVQLTTLIIYPVILTLGVVGNAVTVALIYKDKTMHTPTNVYLLSLATGDLVQLCVGIPLELLRSLAGEYPWGLGGLVCWGRLVSTEAASYAAVLTITAFSVERWLAICFPFKVRTSRSRAVKVVGALWAWALLAALPVALFAKLNRLPPPPDHRGSLDTEDFVHIAGRVFVRDTSYCALDSTNPHANAIVINWSFWAFFCLPMVTISLIYLHIGITVRRAARVKDPSLRQANRRRGVIRLLVGVVICFFVCWSPYHAQRMLIVHVDWASLSPFLHRLINAVFYVSGYFYYSNSALNPVLYSLLSKKFRNALIRSLCPAVVQRGLGRPSGSMTMSRAVRLSGPAPTLSGALSSGLPRRCASLQPRACASLPPPAGPTRHPSVVLSCRPQRRSVQPLLRSASPRRSLLDSRDPASLSSHSTALLPSSGGWKLGLAVPPSPSACPRLGSERRRTASLVPLSPNGSRASADQAPQYFV